MTSGIKSLVAELDDMRYGVPAIARWLRCSERQVRRILQDIKPKPPEPETIDGLPEHLRGRIQACIDERPERPNRTSSGMQIAA